MVELVIDDRSGGIWDLSQLVSELSWKTSRIGRPASLEFTLLQQPHTVTNRFRCENGYIVRLRVDERDLFYGYVFSVSGGKSEDMRVLAYDQVRYLMTSDTYVLSDVTATEVVQRIATDFELQLGRLDDTGYRIPTMVEDGQKLLDVICKALDLTLIHSGRNFVFFDDFGELTIRNIEELETDFYLGADSLLYDYDYESSIDSSTYNRIKLYRDNKESGKRELYIVQDSATIARWGLLQLYESVDENRNEAQIKELLDTYITLRNRESRTIKLRAIGDTRLRAGCYVPVILERYDLNQPFLVEECTHSFEPGKHTMNLELKVI
ncbi:hypothetical protein IDH44_13355 [Paenibacillus sp. IB182496]|uniref:YqbQ/XkdQ domain-containing protein n=1 Tax=Paenibacillus sabuli TaxID=2772509 RepID=A0A927BTU3_9BACL|nr:hypothetical protein [Paenibacillus sabuli]MBD2846187.1 hypothetical protein [Paenibacillus sabuli]